MPLDGYEVVERYADGSALLRWRPGGETFRVERVPGAAELFWRARGRDVNFRELVEELGNPSRAKRG